MRNKFLLSLIGEVICICVLVGMVCFQTHKVAILNNHIEYLEVYIQDNGLPTPAMRIK